MSKKYTSKLGLELVIPIISVLVSIFSLVFNHESLWFVAIILVLVLIFVTHTLLTTYYVIEGSKLKIKSGFTYNKEIEINKIKTIKKSNSFISAPATSFDRLEIRYGKYDHVLVSPKLKREFVADILAINPNVEVVS